MSKHRFKASEVIAALNNFDAYTEDLLETFDENTFTNAFNVFIDHCETNPVMIDLCLPLKTYSKVKLREWYQKAQATGGSFIGSKRYDVPKDAGERLALFYQFILAVHDGSIDLVGFCLDFFGNTTNAQMLSSFKKAFLNPLLRDLRNRLSIAKEQLDLANTQHDIVPEQLNRVFLGDVNNSTVLVNIGSVDTKQSVTIRQGENSELSDAIEKLKAAVKRLEDQKKRTAALEDLDGVTFVSKQRQPSVSKVKPFIENLTKYGDPIAQAANVILDIVRKLWP